jgi:hypothetical protein
MALRPVALAIACLSVLAAAAAPAATPLDELIEPAAGKSACFVRVYDAAHLQRIPRQKTTSIVVWLKYQPPRPDASGLVLDLGLAISQRGDPAPFFAQGDCVWDARANRDTSNRPLIKTYRKDAGAICMMAARPDVFAAVSAEEGGALIFERGQDRDTLMLYLDDRLTMVKRASRARQLDIRFGADDRVFMLRRTDIAACSAVENAVTEPEPGVSRR